MSNSQPRRLPAVFLALVLVVGGVAAYAALLEHTFLRESGLLLFLGCALASVAAVWALLGDRRWWVKLAAGLPLMLVAIITIGFFGVARLPPAQSAGESGLAPEFTLPDTEGRPVALATLLEHGPVLLVFFRGSW